MIKLGCVQGVPEEGINFHELILEKGGIGDATGLPKSEATVLICLTLLL